MAKFKGFEENIERMEISSGDATFEVTAEIFADDELKELLR